MPDDNVVDSAKLINNGLKCLDRWPNSNEIRIDADRTKFMLFIKFKFPLMKLSNNKLKGAALTNF